MNIAYHIKTVYRNFISQRPYSFLNLIGLSMGLSIAFIALLCVTEHTGYDAHHENSKQIYRLLSQRAIDGTQMSTNEKAGLAKTLKNQIPEIIDVFGYYSSGFRVKEENKLNENRTELKFSLSRQVYADPSIVNVLSFNLINGNFDTFEKDPKTIIVSETYALHHFNTVLVAGKTIAFEGLGTFSIGAVFKDFPQKSTFNLEVIVPIKNYSHPSGEITPEELPVNNYFLLEKNANPQSVLEKINKVVKPLLRKDESVVYKLQELEQVHLYSEGIDNNFSDMSIKKLASYGIIGVLVLLISLMNFLLLYSAIAQRRLKELMLRKVHGLSALGLLKLFLIESILISVVSSMLALVITHFLIPIFNDVTGTYLEPNLTGNYVFLGYIMILVILISLLSSSYLYLRLKKYNAVDVFNKNNLRENRNFNNGIVIFQFMIVSVMIVFSIGYYKQLHFIINADKGYKTEDIVVIYSTDFNTSTVREELLRHPSILSVASGYSLPSNGGETTTMSKHWDDPEKFRVHINQIDANYLAMYQIELIEGKNFTENSAANEIIVNETAVKRLGLTAPIGEEISIGVIIGVVKDYNMERFSEAITPVSFTSENKYKEPPSRQLSIKYLNGNKQNAMLAIKEVLDKEFPNNHVDLNAYDSQISMQYAAEKTMLKVILALTVSAIFITILGLVGISLFKTQQKTKEIGIRKVNGATITEIMLMLNKDFVKWVAIAFVMACPIAYYATNKWLENYAYKTSLSCWVFALAGVFTLVIALVTVSWQTYRAATRNPVESLRDE